ncbi:hypothetical protein GA0116948_110126 [Chitinophaga costaii]|uniref:Uncharacterized protein n=1 Tax=Chitinophaga costaii TaxID=1335309 RepID=A0A1C4EZ47_9BACT|nr:hypothetical protein [Chitinophaga costaii]PUZ21542.1 hypothetical protein DCM91_16015 [Chitinophaga costaii]SCC48745.1 hypothetical protein GA0116948_110126 [Chitinophaga costaii]
MGEFLSANTLSVDTILQLTEEKITAPAPALAALDVILYAFTLPATITATAMPQGKATSSLAAELAAAFDATDLHADFIFQRTFSHLTLDKAVGNRGVVLYYQPAGHINTVEQQLYATLSTWGLPGDQALVQDIARLIFQQAAATGNTPLATYGQAASTVMRIEGPKVYALFGCWTVALATFPLGDDQTALLYSFKAATTELSTIIV